MLEPHPYQLIPTPNMRSFLRSVQDVHGSCKFQLHQDKLWTCLIPPAPVCNAKASGFEYCRSTGHARCFLMSFKCRINCDFLCACHSQNRYFLFAFQKLLAAHQLHTSSQIIAGLQSRVAAAHQQWARCHSDCWCMALIAVTENCRINSRLTIRHNGLTGWQGLNEFVQRTPAGFFLLLNWNNFISLQEKGLQEGQAYVGAPL